MTTNSHQAADGNPENDKDPLDVQQEELTERLAVLSKAAESNLAELREQKADEDHVARVVKAMQRRMDGALEMLERANEQESLDIPNSRRSWQRQAQGHVRFYEMTIERQSQPREYTTSYAATAASTTPV